MLGRNFNKVAHQGQLEKVLSTAFNGENILVNTRHDHGFEVDLLIPSLKLAFEFQDAYHYVTTWYSQSNVNQLQLDDYTKREAINGMGYTIVWVPCWWDTRAESLLATIEYARPDLTFSVHSNPIPLNPPINFFQGSVVPDVGEIMLATFVPDTMKFLENISSDSPWWLGEKYDGFRCIWNPKRGELYTRRGLKLDLPPALISQFPNSYLDGEIWCGRGLYSDVQRVLSSSLPNWSFFRVVAFDSPALPLHNITFEKRYKYLLRHLPLGHPFIVHAMRIMVKRAGEVTQLMEHLGMGGRKQEEETIREEKVREIESSKVQGGSEGIILRRAKSLYVSGRAAGSLVKIKSAHGDAEALVISVRNDGQVELQLPNKLKFETKHSNVSVKEGDVVTFTYDEYSKRETPVNPVIQRIRKDVEWKDVIYDFGIHKGHSKIDNSSKSESRSGNNFPKIFWANTKNRKKFFDDFAKNKEFDPLVAYNWYKFTLQDVRAVPGSKHVLRYYKKNFVKALLHLYPDIGLDAAKFKSVPRGYWSIAANRKSLFDDFAKANDFDPLVPDNWYGVKASHVMFNKNYGHVLHYHKGSFPVALMELYPDIGLSYTKFNISPREFWSVKSNQRKALDDYAASNQFDPHFATNWYSIDAVSLFAEKDMGWIAQYYKNDLRKAITSLYPSLQLRSSLFAYLPKLHWSNRANRKEFFDDIAEDCAFDPLVSDSWKSLDHSIILQRPHATSVLEYYKGDIINALSHIYSWNTDALFWKDKANRRTFFETFAREHKFDPLVATNWYEVSKASIVDTKGSEKVLEYYQGDIYKALKHLFPECAFQRESFNSEVPELYWKVKSSQRKFFDSFAYKNNFDPLVADNWHNISTPMILAEKNANDLLVHYNGSVAKAIETLYPIIGIDRNKFIDVQRSHWANPRNRKLFFDDFAREHEFDPLVADNWYMASRTAILAKKNAPYVMEYYRGNYAKALEQIYPNIGLNSSKFATVPRGHWGTRSNRKAFFDDFATAHSFDPLIPDNWISVDKHVLLSTKNSSSVLKYYNGDVQKALQDVYLK